jgi:glycosyltransferase involved in cell wall biosynthesis
VDTQEGGLINLHVYPSPMVHDSRIFRETEAIAQWRIFDRVVLVGIRRGDLVNREDLDHSRKIVRLAHGKSRSAFSKIIGTIAWSWRVYSKWSQAPVACINCHSLPMLPLCVILKLRTGAKLVYDPHELETEANGLSGPRRLLSRVIERLLIRRADAQIVVGDAIADWYADTYGIARPAVVMNCPDRPSITPSNRLHQSLGLDDTTNIFLYQGKIAIGRGIELILAAFAELDPDIGVAVFMGDGPLAAQVRAAGKNHPNIRWHPPVAPADLPEYTASARAAFCLIESVCLSYEYCLPNKLFEYLGAHVPVIATDLRELGPLIRRYGVGVLVPASPSVMDVRHAVMQSLTLSRSTLDQGFGAVARAYSWDQQLRTLRQVYASLIGRGMLVSQAAVVR